MNIDDLDCIITTLIRQMYVHPVRFEMIYDDINLEDITDLDCEIDPEIIDELKTYGWNWVPYPWISTIKVISVLTGNDDTRGGGCGNLDIPQKDFRYTISREPSVTIRDIVECIYRLKGSKYDWWYELFTGVKVLKSNNNKLTLQAIFDYGS